MYHAGLGRARADWLIGMNLSRLYTLLAVQSGFDGVISVGRVQTPTLALVVRRDREIATFIPKPFWQVKALLSAGGRTFPAQWVPAKVYTDEEKRCVHQNIAQQVAHLCRQAGAATVTECETKREKRQHRWLFRSALYNRPVACSGICHPSRCLTLHRASMRNTRQPLIHELIVDTFLSLCVRKSLGSFRYWSV